MIALGPALLGPQTCRIHPQGQAQSLSIEHQLPVASHLAVDGLSSSEVLPTPLSLCLLFSLRQLAAPKLPPATVMTIRPSAIRWSAANVLMCWQCQWWASERAAHILLFLDEDQCMSSVLRQPPPAANSSMGILKLSRPQMHVVCFEWPHQSQESWKRKHG